MANQARTIRLPVHLEETVNKLHQMHRDLSRDLGREPTSEELAQALNLTPKRVVELRRYAREPVSLDLDVGKQDTSPLGEFIEDTTAVIAFDAATYTLLQDQVRAVLATLPEREAGVLRLRFGFTGARPRTLDEIGQVYGVSRERIRQIQDNAISKLRHPTHCHVLRDYLG
jgi:RNA polymerase primary sigma factor